MRERSTAATLMLSVCLSVRL